MSGTSLLRPLLLLFVCIVGCKGARSPRGIQRPCIPTCHRTSSCDDLEETLVAVRQRFLGCVGRNAQRGYLVQAHRCYRSLRLLESARWWLKTLIEPDAVIKVYQPDDRIRLEFLCCIERLTRARTADEVERMYLEMIRHFP